MLYSCVDIWELLAIYRNSNDMFAEKAIWETWFCVCTCLFVYILVPSDGTMYIFS